MLNTLKEFLLSIPEMVIEFHTMGFEMIGEFSYNLNHYGLGEAILWLIGDIIAIVLMLLIDIVMGGIILYICYKISIAIRTKEVIKQRGIGTVIDKEYKKECTSSEYNVIFQMSTMQSSSAQYNVKVEYEGIIEIFNNEEIFKKYEKNDDIPVILEQNLDKNKKIIRQRLRLLE